MYLVLCCRALLNYLYLFIYYINIHVLYCTCGGDYKISRFYTILKLSNYFNELFNQVDFNSCSTPYCLSNMYEDYESNALTKLKGPLHIVADFNIRLQDIKLCLLELICSQTQY